MLLPRKYVCLISDVLVPWALVRQLCIVFSDFHDEHLVLS